MFFIIVVPYPGLEMLQRSLILSFNSKVTLCPRVLSEVYVVVSNPTE